MSDYDRRRERNANSNADVDPGLRERHATHENRCN
jgi:hypothetical protein